VLYNPAGDTILRTVSLPFSPYNLNFGPAGTIYVAAYNEATVFVYDSNLTYLGKYGSSLPHAWGLGVGVDRVVWVTQAGSSNKLTKITCFQGI
jgi:hypothetical protein